MATLPEPAVNRQLYMRKFVDGLPGAEHFETRQSRPPDPGTDQVLIETHYVAVDAALRLVMRDSSDFLFRVQPGDLVHAPIAGRVVQSRHKGFAPGDLVAGRCAVESLCVANGADLEKCDTALAPLPSWLAGFGIAGLTAYFALLDVCDVQPGQTVVINGAAGAVGSMAGQIARIRGARTIGIAGSDEKCRWLTQELGFDAAIDYKRENIHERLQELAPDRINVIFDNVGGPVLDESLRWIAMHGIVLLCGATSQYGAQTIEGPRNYIWLGTMRARLQGYVVFDYAARYGEARRQIAQWLRAGTLTLTENIVDGDIDDFPRIFRGLFEGTNFGKMLIRLPAAR